VNLCPILKLSIYTDSNFVASNFPTNFMLPCCLLVRMGIPKFITSLAKATTAPPALCTTANALCATTCAPCARTNTTVEQSQKSFTVISLALQSQKSCIIISLALSKFGSDCKSITPDRKSDGHQIYMQIGQRIGRKNL
jgi:hypothetical protein